MNDTENRLLSSVTITSGRITACNNMFTEETGFSEAELKGTPIEDILNIVINDQQKDVNLAQLFEKVRTKLSGHVFAATIKNTHNYPIPVNIHAVTSGTGKLSYRLYIKISENRSIDPITELPNGWAIHSRSDYLFDDPKAMGINFSIIVLNVDNFSTINYRYGFDTGDNYLKAIGQKLKSTIKDHALVTRFNNAKFGILIENQNRLPTSAFQSYIEQLCQHLCHLADTPIYVDGVSISKSFSIGVSENNELYESFHAMEIAAETAMLQAKKFSTSRYCFSTIQTPRDILSKKLIIDDFPRAIEQNLINIHYQPQYELSTARLIGLEALSRWQHDTLGNIAPDVFVAIAEEIGLHYDFDLWVISKVCTQIVDWKTQNRVFPKIAINISFKTLEMDTFVEGVAAIIQRTGCPVSHIELEITETASAKNMKTISNNIYKIKKLGIGIAVDDFGCGYSSLSLIKKLHQSLDKLKLDRSLIENICNTKVDREFARQIIQLGKVLDVKILAEGVENSEQSELLLGLGCDYAQGYYFAKPLSKNKAEQLIIETNRQLTLKQKSALR